MLKSALKTVSGMESLKERLEEYARKQGAVLFGVADMSPAHDYLSQNGGEFFRQFPRGISFAVPRSKTIIDLLGSKKEPKDRFLLHWSYRTHSDMNGEKLRGTALGLVRQLEEAGYRAYVPPGGLADKEKLMSFFSQKIAAHLSGLGWIGKNCMVINPELGPRVSLATVLTDAPLYAGAPLRNGCGDCVECVDICPPHSFTGVSFDSSQPREARYNAHLCESYCTGQLKALGVKDMQAAGHVCGLCLYVCPFGR